MIEYHKINSVFKRDPQNNSKTFLIGQYAVPEFEYLSGNEWVWTEKIDGTNVRVGWNGQAIDLGGRTSDAQMPLFLVKRLQELFANDALAAVFGTEPGNVMLVGEGYGAKIQKAGGLYKPDGCDFILFDVLIDDVWLERANVENIAAKLGVGVVPIVARGSLAEAIEAVKVGFPSAIGTAQAEGLVMRPAVELKDRRGHRIITKLKHRDFR